MLRNITHTRQYHKNTTLHLSAHISPGGGPTTLTPYGVITGISNHGYLVSSPGIGSHWYHQNALIPVYHSQIDKYLLALFNQEEMQDLVSEMQHSKFDMPTPSNELYDKLITIAKPIKKPKKVKIRIDAEFQQQVMANMQRRINEELENTPGNIPPQASN